MRGLAPSTQTVLSAGTGCVIALVGVYAVLSTWRGLAPPRRRGQLLPLTVTAGVFLAVGLGVAALGVWLF